MALSCTIQKDPPKAVNDSEVPSCRAGKSCWAARIPSGSRIQPFAVQVTLHVAAKAIVPETSKPHDQSRDLPCLSFTADAAPLEMLA